MKKKIIKKEKKVNKQVVEIHVYIHQEYKPYPYYNPNGTGGNPLYPPYSPTVTMC